jgi:hypothetical protein
MAREGFVCQSGRSTVVRRDVVVSNRLAIYTSRVLFSFRFKL